MLNANPNLSPDDAVDYVKNLKKQGFCSIRFNPYIWPEGQKVSKYDEFFQMQEHWNLIVV